MSFVLSDITLCHNLCLQVKAMVWVRSRYFVFMVISLGDVASVGIISVSILTNTKTEVQTVCVCVCLAGVELILSV